MIFLFSHSYNAAIASIKTQVASSKQNYTHTCERTHGTHAGARHETKTILKGLSLVFDFDLALRFRSGTRTRHTTLSGVTLCGIFFLRYWIERNKPGVTF